MIRLRDVSVTDISDIIDYWNNPDNAEYHALRGAQTSAFNAEEQRLNMMKLIDTPPASRKSTVAIVTVDDRPAGHVILNNIRDPEKQRIHFHMWRHKTAQTTIGDSLMLTGKVLPAALQYFFDTFGINDITGDVAVTNAPANFALQRMGHTPAETVTASYMGPPQPYLRYKFTKENIPTQNPQHSAKGPKPPG